MGNKQTKQIRKDLNHATMFLIFCSLMVLICTSCRSTYREPIADPAIQHSVEIARISEAVTHYGNAIEVLTTDLTSGAEELGTTLTDLSNLMEQYFAGVADLLQRYKHLKQYIDQGTYKERSFDQGSDSANSLDYNPDSS